MSETNIHTQDARLSVPVEPGTNRLFPVFLKLEQLRLVIVGGGYVGAEKLQAVLNNSPATTIKVIAISFSEKVRELALVHPNVELIQKPYKANDLLDADIVMAALNDPITSGEVCNDARSLGKLVNVADQPDRCDFYLGSIVQKGNLKVAVSTNGKSPTVAKRIREAIDAMIPEEVDGLLNNVHLIRKSISGDFNAKVKQLNELTASLVVGDTKFTSKFDHKQWQRIATWSLAIFGTMLVGHAVFSYIPFRELGEKAISGYRTLDPNFHWMVLAGFLAQLVDGALGMGYGVTSTSILLSTGINPAAISGSIHTAEMFASGASGYSHYKFGNVNKKLFKLLVIPGVIGAVLGAILLVTLGDHYSNYIKPVLAVYTLLLGMKIFYNAFKTTKAIRKFTRYSGLAALGGFLDSFGGGGWGPIVTTTLITKGRSLRFVIGTVSLTEFFVTLASAFSFFLLMGLSHWQTIVALIIGSIVAAPIAAKLAGRLPKKTSMILLGILVIIWSLNILRKLF